ncbi:MAG: branched-chain amino acid ABC transporter permease [candidate division WOR-3 bacterium]
METLVGCVANAIILGAMYTLVALGFALLHNIMGILHIAHSVIYMLSGYICYAIITKLGASPWIAMLFTAVLIGLLGLPLERFVFRYFFGQFTEALLVGIAIVTCVQTTMALVIRYQTASIPSFVEGILKVGVVSVSYERLFTAGVGIGLMVAVLLFIKKSKIGLQMQAVAQDLEGAVLQGINIHKVSAVAGAIACFSAAVAGCLMGAYLSLDPFMGEFVLGKALVLVVLGGMGSLGGVLIAGGVLGTLDAIFPVFFHPQMAQALAMMVVVGILVFKPTGFLGREMHL